MLPWRIACAFFVGGVIDPANCKTTLEDLNRWVDDPVYGPAQGVDLVLEKSIRLQRSLSLAALRRADEGFQPPQFFARLTSEHPLHVAVTSSA
jgi:hypothetical protein